MLCAPVFKFTSGSSALLGHPRCGLSIWLLLLAIFNTLFWVYANLFNEKTDKTRKYAKSAIFVWYENGCWGLLGAQSINSEQRPCYTTLARHRFIRQATAGPNQIRFALSSTAFELSLDVLNWNLATAVPQSNLNVRRSSGEFNLKCLVRMSQPFGISCLTLKKHETASFRELDIRSTRICWSHWWHAT